MSAIEYTLPVNTILFSGTDSPETLAAAKTYVHDNKMQKGEVKILRHEGQIVVKAMLPVLIKVIPLGG